MANKWRKFDQGTDACYTSMITGAHGIEPWTQTFTVFQSILENIRQEDKNFAPTLEDLEDVTDWEHDFYGWLEDYLDELDMYKQYQQLLNSAEYLLKAFAWTDDDVLSLRFHKAQSLWELGKTDQALSFCERWMKQNPESISAKNAYVYACIHKGSYQDAWNLVNDTMITWDRCNEDLYGFYFAVDRLCDATGDTEKKEKIQRLIAESDEKFDVELEAWLEEEDFDTDEDIELPFN